MYGRRDAPVFVTGTQTVKTGIGHLGVISKVFRRKPEIEVDHLLFAEELLRVAADLSGQLLFVNEEWITAAYFKIARTAHALGDACGHFHHAFMRLFAPLLIKRPGGTLQVYGIRDDIGSAIGNHLPKRRHARYFGIGHAADYLLQRGDDMGGNDHGIDILLGLGTVTATAF